MYSAFVLSSAGRAGKLREILRNLYWYSCTDFYACAFCGSKIAGKTHIKIGKEKRGGKKMLVFYAKLFLFLLQKTIYLEFLFG